MGHIEWEMPAVPQMVCSQEAPRLEVTVWEASLEVALKAEGMDEKGPGRMLQGYKLLSSFQS